MLTAKLKLYSKDVITCKIFLDDVLISSTYGHMVTFLPHEGKMHTLTINNEYNHTDYHVDEVIISDFEWTEETVGGLTVYSCDTKELVW